MAFRLAPWALILLLSYSLVTIVNVATSTPPTAVHFFTDSNCKSLFATVQTAANVGQGQCGILPPGISSASAVFLDDGCFVTIYTDDCNDGATAVRLNECAALHAASFSIDCPDINGTYDPGYTTLTARGTPSTTSATPVVLSTNGAKSSPVALGSTTAPEQEQSSVTNVPGPSAAISDPSSAHILLPTPSSFTTTSTSTPSTLSPPSQSSTTSPFTPNSPTSPTSSSASRNSQTSLQPSSSSSSSSASSPSSPSSLPLTPSPSSTKAQQGTNNNSSLSGHTKLILVIVLPIAGLIIGTAALLLGILRIKHTKKPPPSRKESETTSSNPFSNHLPYPDRPTAELDGDRCGELDASLNIGYQELASRQVYEMESRRVGRNKEMGIPELIGDGEHPKELD